MSLSSIRLRDCQDWAEASLENIRSYKLVESITAKPKYGLYGLLLIACVAWLTTRALQSLKGKEPSRSTTPDIEKPKSSLKAPQRPFGGEYTSKSLTRERYSDLVFSMGASGFQKTNCATSTQLGRPNYEAKAISAFSMGEISYYYGIAEHGLERVDRSTT